MYFPIGWSKTLKIRLKSNESLVGATADGQQHDDERLLNDDEKLLSIKTSSDKSFLCVLTNFSLRIWFCKVNYFFVCVLILRSRRLWTARFCISSSSLSNNSNRSSRTACSNCSRRFQLISLYFVLSV